MRTLAFIGAGRVGTALAVHLARKGYQITAVASRSRASAESFRAYLEAEGAMPEIVAGPNEAARKASLVFITTADRAISRIAEDLAESGSIGAGHVLVHTSGALSSEEALRAASARGAGILAFHPLQSIATIERGIEVLPHCTVFLDGDAAGLEAGREMASALGTPCLTIPPDAKLLYHAAACMASNYLVTLLGISLDLLGHCGLPATEALPALMPLVRGSIENVAALGIPGALTGPIERGDQSVIANHVSAIRQKAPEVDAVYRVLGSETVRLAAAKGRLSPSELASMLGILGVYDTSE